MASSEHQSSALAQNLAASNTKFAWQLYQQLASSNSGGNIFLSPISISVALAMTYLGARGNTSSQMKDTLHFGDVADDVLHQSFHDTVTSLKNTGGNYALHMANRLYGEKSYTFLDNYLVASGKYYGAELTGVDFVNDSSGAAALINTWVAEQTNQKIPEIIPAGVLNNLTRLIIVNAIYFKGDWIKKFDKAKTENKDFHVSNEKSVQVPLMYMSKMKANYGVNQELNCQVIELPYVKDTLSMFVLLPDNTVTNLSEVESKLTADMLSNVLDKFSMSTREVNVWLPRFKLDEKLSLSDTLSSMGMDELFKEGKADLSGIDGTKELYVSQILHRAFIEVNEEGSEAAAATAVIMMTRSVMIKDSFDFKADHPFLFFIRDNITGSVLFLGRVANP